MGDSVIVALSGGQDSTLCLAWARQQWKRCRAVIFNYGQRHNEEITAACYIAGMLGVEYELVSSVGVLLGDSPLVDKNKEVEKYDSFQQMQQVIGDRIEHTFVPMRNDLFLTILANRAVVHGTTDIVIGVCADDAANYPDCRSDYLEAKSQAINLALGRKDPDRQIRIIAPLVNLTKREICGFGLSVRECYRAWAYSRTSYEGDFPLGKDHASVLRAQGFEQAGVPDPLVVAWWNRGLLELPNTVNYDVVRQNNRNNGLSIDDLIKLVGAQ